MAAVLAFGVVLFVATLLSYVAHRTVLSTAVVFLVAGFLAGDDLLGLAHLTADDPFVEHLATVTLFTVLFAEGMRVPLRELRSSSRLPARALVVGLPLTFAGTAVLSHFVAGLAWLPSFLLSAALSPTDPVFATAIVGRDEVPQRLRHLLNVESGLNDGLALPVVIVLLSASGSNEASALELASKVLGGVIVGVAISFVASRIERLTPAATPTYEPLHAAAIGLIVFATASLLGANVFLAAFAAGVTVATVGPRLYESFEKLGAIVSEVLKLAALFVFGSLISPDFLAQIAWSGYAFAFLALLFIRPLALGVAFIRSGLSSREWVAAAWFGPKGFASVVYGILILQSGRADGDELFHLVFLVIALSVIAHSSTDVIVARWFVESEREESAEDASIALRSVSAVERER